MKRLLKWLIFIVLLLAVLLALLPLAAKHWLVRDLNQQGYNARIDTFSFNPFTGKLKLAGVDIQGPQKPTTQITELEGRLKWSQVPKRAVVLKKVKANGIKVDTTTLSPDISAALQPVENFLNQYADSWQFGIENGVADEIELCRSGDFSGISSNPVNDSQFNNASSDVISQCLVIGRLSIRDIVINKTVVNSALDTSAVARWQFNSTDTLHFHNLYLRDKNNDAALLHLTSAEINGLQWTEVNQSADLIVVNGLHFFERNELERQAEGTAQPEMSYYTQFDQLRADAFNMSQTGIQAQVAMESLSVTALQQVLTKLPAGYFEQELLMREKFPILSNKLGLAGGGTALAFKTGRLQILEGQIAWSDSSVSPPAKAMLTGFATDIGPFDSQSNNVRTPISLSARLGGPNDEGRDIQLQGHWTFFSQSLNASIKGKIAGLDLKNLSAYTQDYISENAVGGRVDASFDFVAKQSNVIGSGSVRFSDLITQGGHRSGGLPLQESFSRLKEVNGSVDVPLTYTFKAADLTALLKGFSSEAKYTLSERAQGREPRRQYVPPKPLLSETLKYNPNTQALLGAQFTRLKAIIKQAQQNPQKTLYLCPITTGGEWSQLYNQGRKKAQDQSISESEKQVLSSLSGSRADYIKAYIENEGLVGLKYRLCQAKIDLDIIGPSYLSAELR